MKGFGRMKFGLTSGLLWGLDTVVLGIGLSMSPFIGTAEAIAFAAIASAALHDIFCAIWLLIYMGVRGRLGDTLAALKTRSGKAVILGALLGGPIGMTGYVIAINNIGAGYTAIISSFYPAVGAFLAFVFLKERMAPKQFVALLAALAGIIVMGYVSSGESELGNPILGLFGALLCGFGMGVRSRHLRWVMCATMPSTTRRRFRSARPRRARVRDRRIAAIRCLGFHGRSCSQSRDGRGRAGCFGWNRVVPVLLQEHLVAYRGGEVHGSQYQLFGLGRPVRARVAGNDADADIDRLLRGHLGGHCIGRKRLERAVRP